MDKIYIPRCSPVIDNRSLRFSVGFYRGKHRVVLAWFAEYDDAVDYSKRFKLEYPSCRVDVLKSLF